MPRPATTAGRRRTRGVGRALLGALALALSLGGWGVTGIATASAASDLAIATASTGDFVVGDLTGLDLRVMNAGPDTTAGTTTVVDTLPSSLSYDSVSAPGWTCSGRQTVTCTSTAVIASGASFPSVTVFVAPTAAAVPSAASHATVSYPDDPGSANNASDFTATVAYAADMSIAASHAGGPLRSGQSETVTFRMHNRGYYRVDGTTTVAVSVPAGLQVTSVVGASGWTCTTAQSFACTTRFDGSSSGNFTTIRVVVRATDAAYPSSTVSSSVTSPGDQNPANNAATDTIFVQAAHDAAVELVPVPAMTVGQLTLLTFRARNAGTDASPIATLSIALPPQLRFVGSVAAGWRCTAGVPVSSCTNSRLITTFDALTVRVKALAPIVAAPMTVTVTTAADQNPANNTAMAPVTIAPYVPQSYAVMGRRGELRSVGINVGDKLAVALPQPRHGPKWRVRTLSTAVNRPFVVRTAGRIEMRFTATHAGRATLRFTRKGTRRKRSRKYTLVVTVTDPGA